MRKVAASDNRHSGAVRTRCAIYTRKSSEEGLEQEFNSLDAQREAYLDWSSKPNAYPN